MAEYSLNGSIIVEAGERGKKKRGLEAQPIGGRLASYKCLGCGGEWGGEGSTPHKLKICSGSGGVVWKIPFPYNS